MTYFKDRKIALQEKKRKKKEHMLNYPRAVIFHEVVKEQQWIKMLNSKLLTTWHLTVGTLKFSVFKERNMSLRFIYLVIYLAYSLFILTEVHISRVLWER